jgi:tetratricopeptide (TPR) repeat protein
VSRYKGKQFDVPAFGRELNVQMIITGKVQKQGEDLFISVALVDVREDNQLWGKRYQGKLGGILDLQDQIARDVAASLRLRLTGAEEQRLTKRYTEDAEAYLLYREAMYQFNKRTERGLTAAIEHLQRAIQRDRNYVLAYETLSRCYFALGNFYQGPRNACPHARKYVAQALKLDDTLADAHSTLAAIYLFHDWNWEAAERELKQALALDSTVPRTWNILGFCQAAKGRLSEALTNIQRAQEIEPQVPLRRHDLAMCYNWRRQYDQSIAEAKKALALDPEFPLAHTELGLAYAEKGAYAEAIVELRKELTADGSGVGDTGRGR